MVNTANTAWKLTDLWNTALFTFDLANGWHPINEYQSPEITGEEYNIPWDNLVQKYDYWLGKRQITLQGVDIDDKDMWALSSAICKRQLMKLWVGEDWFYYVMGIEPRQTRDESLPTQKTYTCGLVALDPHYYYSNSTGGSGTGINWVVPTAVAMSAGTITIDLTATGTDEGTTFLEPCFWIIGGTSTSCTSVTITDPLGRQLTYTPTTTIANTHEHVIMPYRNTVFEGFVVNDATGFKLTANGLSGTVTAGTTANGHANGSWIMDAFNHGAGTDDSATVANNTYAWITEEVPCQLSRNGTSYIDKNRNYPRCNDGVSTALTVTFGNTSTNIAVYAQYCLRRV